MWELEERHLQEKHQQLKQQLKDQYFLQRHQLLKRHEKVRAEGELCSAEIAQRFNETSDSKSNVRVMVGNGADAALQPAAG